MSKYQVADVDREGASNDRCPLAVRTALPKHQCLSYQDDLYQGGPILRAVQLSDILLDGKEFVDRPALNSPNTVHADWRKLCEETKGRELTQEELADFVEKHFGKSGWELEACVVPPTDFEKVPAYLDKLTDAGLILLGQEIQEIWMNLGKRVKPEVLEMEKRTSMLYIPNFFVIPGGRFKEIYYWDTYWIVKAFLRAGSFSTARGVIENYFYLIRQHGFVPNGNRSYYLDRSQPPLLIAMVRDYVQMSGDVTILTGIDLLLQEVAWFEKNRSVQVDIGTDSYSMFRYGSNGCGPRPESYKEDLEIAESAHLHTREDQEELYQHIRAGAESGWDFSARWIINNSGGYTGGLEHIRTKLIVPVDLNSIMYMNYSLLSEFLAALDREAESAEMRLKADLLQEAVMQVMFEPNSGTWRDYDLLNKMQRPFYFASNLFPLWTDCYPAERREELGTRAAEYLHNQDAVRPGGLITSTIRSGLQWDAPNCWAPLQEVVVTGLLKTGSAEGRKTALQIANNFTLNALERFDEGEGHLYEKYDANVVGQEGGGGEYTVQTGFGWTNGVLIEFISVFGDELLEESTESKAELTQGHLVAPGWSTLHRSALPHPAAS